MADKTGSVINDKYVIGKLIGRDGVHEVYESSQRIVDGIERKVAIKLLHDWPSMDEQERAFRIEELGTIAEIGAHPFISSVYDCGVDESIGPWRAMEMAIGALDQRMGVKPASPVLVRTVMNNMLQALILIHEREKPIIHNNIKPRSILQLTPNAWALGNFNLATRTDTDQTLSEVTVKYAAPEVLDVDQGEVGAKSDLYSLGFCLYELALGQERFEELFPSVYGSGKGSAKRGSSENDKWVYWHVSPQLNLPALREVLPDFPEDLSEAIKFMIRKPLADRATSAWILLESIGQQDSSAGIGWEKPDEPEKEEDNPALRKTLITVIAVLLVLAIAVVGGRAILSAPTIPVLTLDNKTHECRERFITVVGTVEDMIPGNRLILSAGKDLLQNRTEAKIDSDTGKFSAQLELPVLGEYEGLCGVVNAKGDVLATTLFTIVRYPPKTVAVAFVTRPSAFSAEVLVRELVSGTKQGEWVPAGTFTGTTDEEGCTSLAIPYGPYDLQVKHPRYRPYKRNFDTGLGKARPVELRLIPLPPSAVAAKRLALRDEYETLKALAAAGDPKAIMRMAQIQKELAQLADKVEPSIDADTDPAVQAKTQAIREERMALLKEASDLQARAAAGDPEAIKRLQEINKRLQQLDTEEATLSAESAAIASPGGAAKSETQAELQALAERRAELVRRAAEGDPEAIAALKKLDQELREKGINPDNILAGRAVGTKEVEARARAVERAKKREAIQKRMAELAARVAAGDPAAIEEMRKLQKTLAALDEEERQDIQAVTRDLKRQAILAEMKSLEARAAAGDPVALARLRQLKGQLAGLEAQDAAAKSKQKRQAILDEMESLKARVAAGDPEAIKRMRELKKQLAQVDVEDAVRVRAEKRRKLVAEMESLKAKAAAGDPEAKARLKELQKELKKIDTLSALGGTAESRRELIKRIQALRERAAKGDPEAIRELRALERKSEILKALSEGRITAEEADQLLRSSQQLSTLDRVTLLSMDKATLKRYLMDDLPRRAIEVTEDAVLNKLHVRGVVLDREELVRVMMRLAPAEERLMLDIRIDPDGLAESLRAALAEVSIAEATVHPFVIGPRFSLFIGLPANTVPGKVEAAKLVVEDFIATPARATVRLVPLPVQLKGEVDHEQQ